MQSLYDYREIKLSDLFEAFISGAEELRQNPHATKEDVIRTADAYVKLWLMNPKAS